MKTSVLEWLFLLALLSRLIKQLVTTTSTVIMCIVSLVQHLYESLKFMVSAKYFYL